MHLCLRFADMQCMSPLFQNTKFKKVKKKVRKIRKKELLKADDLVPLSDQTAEPSDYGSRYKGSYSL